MPGVCSGMDTGAVAVVADGQVSADVRTHLYRGLQALARTVEVSS